MGKLTKVLDKVLRIDAIASRAYGLAVIATVGCMVANGGVNLIKKGYKKYLGPAPKLED